MTEHFEPFELLYSTYIRNDTDQRIKVHAIYSGAVRCFERHYVVPVKETVELMEETYVWQGVERRFCISEITVEGPKRSYPKTTIPLARFISKPTKKCTFVVKMERNTHQHHGVYQSGGALAAAVTTTTATTTAAAITAVTNGEVPTAAIQPINNQTDHQHQPVDVTTATTATAVSDLGERPPPPPYGDNHDNNDDPVHNKDDVQQVALPENPLPPPDEPNTTNTTIPALNVSARPSEFNTASLQHSSLILNTGSTKKQYYFLFERACR